MENISLCIIVVETNVENISLCVIVVEVSIKITALCIKVDEKRREKHFTVHYIGRKKMENISLCIILVVKTKIKHFTVGYIGRKHFIVHYSGRNKDRKYMINGPPLRPINHQFLYLLLAVVSR